jgi:ketosteroid isomerase-like protein
MRGSRLLLFLAALSATQPALSKPASPSQSAAASAQAEIRRLTQEFVEGFNTGDVDKMMRFYAPHYVDVNLRHPHQTWAERREYYRKIVSDRTRTVQVTPAEIVVAGDYAYVWGTIELTTRKAGTPAQVRELRYIEIWKHLPQGWRSVAGIDSELYPDS